MIFRDAPRRRIRMTSMAAFAAAAVAAALLLVPHADAAAKPDRLYPGAQSCVSPHCYSRAVDYHSKIDAVRVTIQHSWFSMLPNATPGYATPVIDNESYRR
jgi:hypothetical protein